MVYKWNCSPNILDVGLQVKWALNTRISDYDTMALNNTQ